MTRWITKLLERRVSNTRDVKGNNTRSLYDVARERERDKEKSRRRKGRETFPLRLKQLPSRGE